MTTFKKDSTMKPSYEQKMNWLHNHMPFIKLDHDLLTKNMKTANSFVSMAGTQCADSNFYLPKKMADAIVGKYCTYNIILNIDIFPDETNREHWVYSLTLTSAEQNFVTDTYNQCIDFIAQQMKEDCIKFSRKEFLMIKSEAHQEFVEAMLNKLILLFSYPKYYQEYDNFFDENAEDDMTLMAMAAI